MTLDTTDDERLPRSARDGLVSVVAPVFNEVRLVGEFHRRVVAALDGHPVRAGPGG